MNRNNFERGNLGGNESKIKTLIWKIVLRLWRTGMTINEIEAATELLLDGLSSGHTITKVYTEVLQLRGTEKVDQEWVELLITVLSEFIDTEQPPMA